MGTSASHRSPPTPRWKAFSRAIDTGESAERIRSEAFNAASDWTSHLAGPTTLAFAQALLAAFSDMPTRFRATERPERAVAELVDAARQASIGNATRNDRAAIALAERAFMRVVVSTARADGTFSELSSEQAARNWEAGRGDTPNRLVREFVGGLLEQFARHAVARDVGKAVGTDAVVDVGKARNLTREVGANAAAAAGSLADIPSTPETLERRWSSLVTRAIRSASRLPRGRRE